MTHTIPTLKGYLKGENHQSLYSGGTGKGEAWTMGNIFKLRVL